VIAMIASYILSRTLVPTLVMLLMRGTHGDGKPDDAARPSPLQRVYRAFDRQFERVRGAYTVTLSGLLQKRGVFGIAFLAFCLLSCGLYPFLGRDFFPTVDAGQIRLHLRAATGTRIEETARLADDVEAAIRQLIPKDQLETILDNLGVPNSGINLSYSNAGTIGTLDGEIQLSLKEGHRPTEEFVSLLRAELPKRFPGIEFFFQPADIVTQILNFGLPAAIDVQFTGSNINANAALAADLVKRIKQIPGAVDAHVHQRLDAPAVNLQMDRTRLQQMGLSAQNVGQNVLVSLSGSSQTAPAFWLNPANGVVYQIAVQAPQYRVDSLDALLNVPVAGTGALATSTAAASTQLLGNLVEATSARQPAVVSRYNITPAIDVYVGVQGTDLASVAARVQTLVDEVRPNLPRGSQVVMRGQVQTMQSSFVGLGVGLAMAIVLVYLLIVVNFQSWIDALIIVAALPAALAGIAWMLFITGTTLSVPALTGAIMTMGVATANSVLLVSFARQRQQEGAGPALAALDAGATRIRPVLMTALAMIIGMIPMALGIGEGAEQNAPLGRAVIGGLLFATVSTLLFVPVVFAGVPRSPGAPEGGACRAPGQRAGTVVAEDLTDGRAPPVPSCRPGQRAGRRGAARPGCARHAHRRHRRPAPARGRRRPDHRQPDGERARSRGQRRRGRGPVREDDGGAQQRRRPDARPAWLAARRPAGAPGGAVGRLRQALDQGHRQPRRQGRTARRHRIARDRPAAVAGRSGARPDGGEPRAG
jgi:multidrug efflux pump subunit AcrB